MKCTCMIFYLKLILVLLCRELSTYCAVTLDCELSTSCIGDVATAFVQSMDGPGCIDFLRALYLPMVDDVVSFDRLTSAPLCPHHRTPCMPCNKSLLICDSMAQQDLIVNVTHCDMPMIECVLCNSLCPNIRVCIFLGFRVHCALPSRFSKRATCQLRISTRQAEGSIRSTFIRLQPTTKGLPGLMQSKHTNEPQIRASY